MESQTRRCWQLDRASLWHPFTRHSAMLGEPFPIISHGEGVYLYDTDGRRYVDAISSWWACNLGHGHPRLVEAIKGQADRLQHSILGNLSHPTAAELAAELVSLFPDRRRRVLFASDGACAVEAALRVAIQYRHNLGQSERRRFVSLKSGYHGDTLGAVSLGHLPTFHAAYDDGMLPVLRADTPACAGCVWGKTPDTCGLECLESMRDIIEQHHREIAAVIVEPLCLGAAGMRIYAAAYLKELRQLCSAHGILLIVDEIAVGMGRTGSMFAFQQAAIDPDIVCLGKGLSGGYLPLSAAIVKQEIYETFADRPHDHTLYHGHTFAGNPLAAAAATECLRVYRDEAIVARAAHLGRVLAEEMELLRATPHTANLRCLGMIAAVDLLDTETEPAEIRSQRLCGELLRRGVLLRPLGQVVYLMLPLITPEDVLRETVATLHDVMASDGT